MPLTRCFLLSIYLDIDVELTTIRWQKAQKVGVLVFFGILVGRATSGVLQITPRSPVGSCRVTFLYFAEQGKV